MAYISLSRAPSGSPLGAVWHRASCLWRSLVRAMMATQERRAERFYEEYRRDRGAC
jgi:hypothetical protein